MRPTPWPRSFPKRAMNGRSRKRSGRTWQTFTAVPRRWPQRLRAPDEGEHTLSSRVSAEVKEEKTDEEDDCLCRLRADGGDRTRCRRDPGHGQRASFAALRCPGLLDSRTVRGDPHPDLGP